MMDEQEAQEIGTKAGQDAVKWVQRNKDRIMLGCLLVLAVKNRSLKNDLAKLTLDKAKLLVENQTIKEAVMNIRVVGNPDYESLYDVAFNAKK